MTTASHEITAAVVREQGAPFVVEQATLRAPRPHEVLVKVVATGLCHTDLIVRDQFYPVPLPVVLGHEGAGVVEEVGSEVTTLAVGDHVVMGYAFCGLCESCCTGAPSYCSDFFGRNFGGTDPAGETAITGSDGKPLHDHFFGQSSFATHALASAATVVRMPKEAPLDLLGPLACGIQTGAGAVVNSLRVTPGTSFVAWGAGAVGLSAVMAAVLAGAETIVAVDVVPSRLDLARELGATHVVDGREVDAVEAVRDVTGGGAAFALESTGVPAVLRQGIDALGQRGSLGFVGAPALGTSADFDVNNLLLGGQTIRGRARSHGPRHTP